MKTLFAKILLWFWSTVAVVVVGAAFVSAISVNRSADAGSPVGRLVRFQLEEARVAYETGGRPALQAFLDNLQTIYHARGILTDEHGRDLLTGQNRSDLIERARRHPPFWYFSTGDDMIARSADDGRFWFFCLIPRERPGAWFLTPDHLFMMLIAVLFCYWLALEITKPVRALQKAVERFGRGDLTARVNSSRRDELGQLARTFDRMAGRIETLLTAARGCSIEYGRGEPITVEGDPELLRRAVENVLRNAIRYSPKEAPIEVSVARNDGRAVVDVRDHGPGVPEEALPRLFDAFYRVETDRDRASGGIGLGLAIARRAIELHKGAIRARNAHPGLEVELELPAAEVHAGE